VAPGVTAYIRLWTGVGALTGHHTWTVEDTCSGSSILTEATSTKRWALRMPLSRHAVDKHRAGSLASVAKERPGRLG